MMREPIYSRSEALALKGRWFRATKGYAGVEAGTPGVVVGIYGGETSGYGVNVEWRRRDNPRLAYKEARFGRNRRTLQDGFSRMDLEMVYPDGSRAMEPMEAPLSVQV